MQKIKNIDLIKNQFRHNMHLYTMRTILSHQAFPLPFVFQANLIYLATKTARCISANRWRSFEN